MASSGRGQRCEIVKEPREAFRDRIGKVVVIAKVYPKEGCVFAYDDKPITYKTNRKGRRVVDHDPSCIQTVYCIDALRVK